MHASRSLNEETEAILISPDAGTMCSGIIPPSTPGDPEENHSKKEEGMFDIQLLRRPRHGVAGREIPFTFSRQRYPRDSSATLTFTLDVQREITLVVCDPDGCVIHTLYDGALVGTGYHELRLYGDAFQANGCFARLESAFGIQKRTIIPIPGSN